MKISRESFAKLWTVAILFACAYGLLGQAEIIRAQDDQMALLHEQMNQSMKDATTIAMCIADYITDYGTAPTQDGTYEVGDAFYEKLSPFYVKVLPLIDPWGGKYVVYCGQACNGKYGLKDCQKYDYVVACLGRDGKKDDWKWNASNFDGGVFKLTSPADFDKDLVMWNGLWVRSPRSE